MDELTYHHIIERCKGGQTTLENGAILRNINHQWFNRQSKERQTEMNKMFQEYKRNFNKINIATAQLTTQGMQKTEIISFEESDSLDDFITIPLEPMTEEDIKKYEEYKKKRYEKIKNKFQEGEER